MLFIVLKRENTEFSTFTANILNKKNAISVEGLIKDSKNKDDMDNNAKILQKAIDDASKTAEEGKQNEVVIPKGTYYFSKQGSYPNFDGEDYIIFCKNNVKIVGKGKNDTILKPYQQFEESR